MYTLSLHNQGSSVAQRHNVRAQKSIGNDDIDSSRSSQNLLLEHKNIRDVYRKLFQDAVDEFNAKQKHQDRKIKDYYDYIKKSKKHICYEMIIQIGSKDEGAPQNAAAIFVDYVQDWKKRNPNLVLVGAYVHMDEATPHVHIDYIPVCQCNRGMRTQTSLTGALKAQGFVSHSSKDTAQIQWEQSERDYLRELCKQYQVPLYEQGIGRKRHLSVGEYKALQDELNALRSQIEPLREENQRLKDISTNLQDECNQLSNERDNIYNQNGVLINKLKQNKVAFDNHMQRLSSQIHELENKIDYLRDIKADLQKENSSLILSKKRLSKRIDDLQTNIDYISSSVSEILGQDLQNQLDELINSDSQSYIYDYDDMER